MLDNWSAVGLALVGVLIMLIIFVIGWLGMHLTEDKDMGTCASHTLQIMYGRGPDLKHPVFAVIFLGLVWIFNAIIIAMLLTFILDTMKRGSIFSVANPVSVRTQTKYIQ